MRILRYSIIFSIIFVTASCSSVMDEQVQVTDVQERTIDEKNAMIECYAQLLASTMGHSSVRNAIKDEALKMFDGDNDVLVSTFHDIQLSEVTDVRQLLQNQQICLTKSSLGNVVDIDEIQDEFKNLQISVPLYCDEWDADNYVPLVAFLPYDYDEMSTTEIVAFDTLGREHLLSTEEDPDVPVVVVSISERVDDAGEFIYAPIPIDSMIVYPVVPSVPSAGVEPSIPTDFSVFHSAARSFELNWSDVSDETGYEIYRKKQGEAGYKLIGTTGRNVNYYVDNNLEAGKMYSYKLRAINGNNYSAYTPTMSSYAASRNDGVRLVVSGLYFTKESLKAVEKWPSGAPEIRLRVVRGIENSEKADLVFESPKLEPARRADIVDKWWSCSLDIMSWYVNAYGTVLTFDWREEDWNQKLEFVLNGSYESKLGESSTIKPGGSVTIPANPGGHHIGTRNVLWWENPAGNYNINGFKWRFNVLRNDTGQQGGRS